MADTFRVASRNEWVPAEGRAPTDTQLALGALQRIADATEVMAKNYVALQAEKERYERWYKVERAKNERLIRSNNALRGYIKRLKATS